MNYLFGCYAGFYDGFMRFWSLDQSEAIMEETRDIRNRRVLDIGGGTGTLADALARRGADVTLADPEKRMTAIARKKNPFVRIVSAHAHELKLPSDSFDYVILRDALHHIANQEEAVRISHRLLRAGGKLLIQEFDKNFVFAKCIRLFEQLCFERCRLFDEKTLLSLCGRYFAANEIRRAGKFEFLYIGRK